MTEIQRLKKRVAELEREVEALKASPRQVFEYHYHQLPSQPYYVPYYPTWPWQPTWVGPSTAGATTTDAICIYAFGDGTIRDGFGNTIQSTPTLTYGPQN